MHIIDIKDMPGYEFKPGFKGVDSVSSGMVFMKVFTAGIYPSCKHHGAILCITKRQDGKIWRCREPGCDEGCFEPISNLQSEKDIVLNFAKKFIESQRDIDPEINAVVQKHFWELL